MKKTFYRLRDFIAGQPASQILCGLSLLLYSLSLVLPVAGEWFVGTLIILLSGLVIGWTLSLANEVGGLNLFSIFLAILLPFINVVYVWCIIRFDNYYQLLTVSTVLLFLSTIIVLTIAALVAWMIHISGHGSVFFSFYHAFIWASSFVLLSIAVFLRWKYD